MSKSILELPALSGDEHETTFGSVGCEARLAYIVSWFPKLTETFIVREMSAVESLGVEIEMFPLRRNCTTLVQSEAQPYVERARFAPPFGLGLLLSNLRAAIFHPARYFSTLLTIIFANLGSRRMLAGALGTFPFAVFTAEEMRKLGIQHIHAHFASHPAVAAWVIWRFTGIGYSFVAHGSDLHRDQHMLLEKTRDAKFVVAISEYNRRMILEKCGDSFAAKVHVVHCGIDPDQFHPCDSPTPFMRGEGVFRIVCVGTLHEVKGQRYLIQACARLRDAGIAFECHLLGDGEDRVKLETQTAALKLQREVVFHGHVNSEQVAKQLQVADCLVAPSVFSRDGRREGIPVVLMEAMASGVAVVASNISGIPELVESGRSGLLSNPGDADSIAEQILTLHSDNCLRHRLAAHGYAHVRKSFDSKSTAEELIGLFSKYVSR